MDSEVLAEALDALFRCVLPTAGVAAAAFVLVTRLWPKRLAPVAVLALGVAFVQGNHLREAVPYRLDAERPLTAGELGSAAWHAIARPASDEEEQPPRPDPQYWLPWVAGLALLTDLAMNLARVQIVLAWIVRGAVSLLAARLLLPEGCRAEMPWPEAVLAAAMLATWAVAWSIARRQEAGGWVALALAIALQSAALAVLLLAAWLSLADVALIAASALAGVALASWAGGERAEGSIGAAAVLLPSVLLMAKQNAPEDVPNAAFVLAALSPLALTPLLLAQRWLSGRWLALAGLVLVSAPAGAAGVMAALAWLAARQAE
jgi:hypothetical protein